MSIRSAAKALILHQEKILLNKCHRPQCGDYYSLPGGGQHDYETLQEAVIRECREETGFSVRPEGLSAVYEEICDDLDFRERHPAYAHKVYHVFKCSLENTSPLLPTEMDSMQIASQWVRLSDLESLRILPEAIGKSILALIQADGPVFLGSHHVAFEA